MKYALSICLLTSFRFLSLFSHEVVSYSLWPHGLQHAHILHVLHHLLVFANYVHWVGDAIQPSHPLSSPSPPSLNLSQHQGLFQWVCSLHQVVKALANESFSISPSKEYSGLISFRINWFDLLASSRDSQESSPAPQFKSIWLSFLHEVYFLCMSILHPFCSCCSQTMPGHLPPSCGDVGALPVLAPVVGCTLCLNCLLPKLHLFLTHWNSSSSHLLMKDPSIWLVFPELIHVFKWWVCSLYPWRNSLDGYKHFSAHTSLFLSVSCKGGPLCLQALNLVAKKYVPAWLSL